MPTNFAYICGYFETFSHNVFKTKSVFANFDSPSKGCIVCVQQRDQLYDLIMFVLDDKRSFSETEEEEEREREGMRREREREIERERERDREREGGGGGCRQFFFLVVGRGKL